MLRMLSRLGCRVSEMIGITVEDIDFERNTIMIRHLKSSRGNRQCEICRRKVGKRAAYCPYCGSKLKSPPIESSERFRLVPVDKGTLVMLQNYISEARITEGKVFGITRQSTYQIVREAAQRAGLGKKILTHPDSGRKHFIHPHNFRDALAVLWLNKQNDPKAQKALQTYLGHKNFDTTARYLKYSTEDIREIYDSVWTN